jgi:hypothetical protein
MDAVVVIKIPSPRRESNRRIRIVQPVAQRYTDWAIVAVSEKSVFLRCVPSDIAYLSGRNVRSTVTKLTH